MYYTQNDGRNKWLDMKLNSYLASSKVTAAAMEQRYADLYAQTLNIEKRVENQERREYALQINNGDINSLQYNDELLKNWSIISYPSDFIHKYEQINEWSHDNDMSRSDIYIKEEMFDMFKDFVKNYFTYDKDGIRPNSFTNDSIRQSGNFDASLMFIWAMSRYLEFTKDYDLLNTIANSKFFQKQTIIIQYLLKEIINKYRDKTPIEDIWPQHSEKTNHDLYAAIDLREP